MMRYCIGLLAGITITLLCVKRGARTLRWIFTRVEVPTDPACAPRYWTSHHGVITKGEWT